MPEVIDYARPGPLTSLVEIDRDMLAPVANDPVTICSPVHALVLQPGEAKVLGLPPERLAENQFRPAAKIISALLALSPAPLSVSREPRHRVVGTCRHFALLSCALLRYRGIPARARCGFATYFQPGQGLDHWVTEYWDKEWSKWVRVDSEILGQQVLARPEDLRPGSSYLAAKPGAPTGRAGSTPSALAYMGLTTGVQARSAATSSKTSLR